MSIFHIHVLDLGQSTIRISNSNHQHSITIAERAFCFIAVGALYSQIVGCCWRMSTKLLSTLWSGWGAFVDGTCNSVGLLGIFLAAFGHKDPVCCVSSSCCRQGNLEEALKYLLQVLQLESAHRHPNTNINIASLFLQLQRCASCAGHLDGVAFLRTHVLCRRLPPWRGGYFMEIHWKVAMVTVCQPLFSSFWSPGRWDRAEEISVPTVASSAQMANS